jgi:hypothetical protein
MGWPSPAKNRVGSPPADPLFQSTRGHRMRLAGSIPFGHPSTPAKPGGSRSGGPARRPGPVSACRSDKPRSIRADASKPKQFIRCGFARCGRAAYSPCNSRAPTSPCLGFHPSDGHPARKLATGGEDHAEAPQFPKAHLHAMTTRALEVLEGLGGGRDAGLVRSVLGGVLGLDARVRQADLDLVGEVDVTDTVRRRRNPRTWTPDFRDREGLPSRGIRNPGSGILPRQRHP